MNLLLAQCGNMVHYFIQRILLILLHNNIMVIVIMIIQNNQFIWVSIMINLNFKLVHHILETSLLIILNNLLRASPSQHTLFPIFFILFFSLDVISSYDITSSSSPLLPLYFSLSPFFGIYHHHLFFL